MDMRKENLNNKITEVLKDTKQATELLRSLHNWFMETAPEHYNGCGLWFDVDDFLKYSSTHRHDRSFNPMTTPNQTEKPSATADKSAHTPAPWAVQELGGHVGYPNWKDYAVRSNENVHIATVGHIDRFYEHSNEANARLIAASPAMFDYITKQANKGDKHAAEIIANI